MSAVNYLQVGEKIHCFHCHEEVRRDEFVAHWDAIPVSENVYHVDVENCKKCAKFGTQNLLTSPTQER